jgi:hypothetical protein
MDDAVNEASTGITDVDNDGSGFDGYVRDFDSGHQEFSI